MAEPRGDGSLAPLALAPLPPGCVRAQGWLREQLRLSADGLTGHLTELWPDVGAGSGWLGGDGESWERGPYYVRGLVTLAHVLGDARLVAQAQPWLEWTLASQRDDGFFGPSANDEWWARSPMVDALRTHHDATGDARVPAFLERWMGHQLRELPGRPILGWARPRGADAADSAAWLWERTRAPFLLELIDLLQSQTSDWASELARPVPSDDFELAHGVNRAMGFKAPAVFWRRTRDARLLDALRDGWRTTMAHHGQIEGLYSCDEMLHGRGATQGAELCTIVELLSSFGRALEITGEAWLGDAMERLAFNALPAATAPDLRARQYFQQPNQVACTSGAHRFWYHHDTDLLFGTATGYGCCTANMHLAWPQLASRLWMRTPDGGLAATILAPCAVDAEVGAGSARSRVRIDVETGYPFRDEVVFAVHAPQPVEFCLTVRVPAWAEGATIDGAPVAAGAFATVRRTWRGGERVALRLPMRVALDDEERGAVGVVRGPLVYALGVAEEWRRVGGGTTFADHEVVAAEPWSFALRLDRQDPARSLLVRERALAERPWTRDTAPVVLEARGRHLPGWTLEDSGSAAPVPESPVPASASPDAADRPLVLVPYGSTRARIACLPVLA